MGGHHRGWDEDVAAVAVVALAGQRSAWYPWALLIGGALVSVTANAIHAVVAADADVPGVLAAAVAAVPPVVLLAITHLTVILTRPQLAAEVPASTDESAIEAAAIEDPGPDAAWEPVSAVTAPDGVEAAALWAPTSQENDPVAAPGTRQASAARRADPQGDAATDAADRRARAAALRGQEHPILFALNCLTAPANAAGVPALTVPCGFSDGGLPVGLQVMGRPFDEATVLRVGAAYEAATTWHLQSPPLP